MPFPPALLDRIMQEEQVDFLACRLFSKADVDQLADVLKRKKNMLLLDLSGTNLTDKRFSIIKEALLSRTDECSQLTVRLIILLTKVLVHLSI